MRTGHRRGRRTARLGAGALVAVLAVLLLPARADAHAELVSTEPAASEQLATAPGEVVLHFTEAVDLGDDALEVLDANANRLDVGEPEHPDGDRTAVSVSLPELDDGAYVVAWRVVSSDSHPIGGAFTFRVGEAGATSVDDQALIEDVLGGSRDGDATLGAVYGVVRFVAFAGLTVLVGAVVFLAWLWPVGAADRRARRVVGAAWVTSVVATVLCIPLQGAYAIGGTLGDALDLEVITDEIGARTGRSWVVRLLLLAAAAVVWPRLSRGLAAARSGTSDGSAGSRESGGSGSSGRSGVDLARGVAVVGGLALLVTVSLTGHAVSGDLVLLAFVADVVHLSGVSVWLGGLAVLAFAVLWPARPRSTDEGVDADRRADTGRDTGADTGPDPDGTVGREALVSRFSQVAFGAVVAIVVSGTVQGWRQVGGYDALFETTYGRLLVLKVVLFAGMLLAAAVSRSWVRRRATARSAALALSAAPGAAAASPEAGRARLSLLRQSVGAEVGLAVAVLAVTSLLVNAVPGESAEAGGGGGPFNTQVTEDDIVLTLDVVPAEVGPVAVHIFLNEPGGAPVLPEEVDAELALPEEDLGPITVSLVDFGQGHYSAESAEIPFAGDWDLEITVRTSDIDQTIFDVVVPVS